MLTETIRTYLDVLEIYTDEQVADACLRLARENRAFPPAAGEVRAMCERVVVASMPARPVLVWDADRPPANELTPEQRAENVKRLQELVVELASNKELVSAANLPIRPAPFHFGPELMASMVEKGLLKAAPRAALDDGEDAPTF